MFFSGKYVGNFMGFGREGIEETRRNEILLHDMFCQ